MTTGEVPLYESTDTAHVATRGAHRRKIVPLRAALSTVAPARVLTWTFCIYTIGLLLAPMTPQVPLDAGATVFWIVTVLCALAGATFGSPARVNVSKLARRRNSVTGNAARRMARISLWMGVAGVILSAYDRYIIRGAPIGFDFIEARDIIADAGSGPVAVIAAFTSSFAPFSLVTTWLARFLGRRVSTLEQSIAALSLGAYLLMSVSLGSRSLLLVCVLIHLLAAIFLHLASHNRLGSRVILGTAALGIVIVGALAWIMLERLNQMGLSPLASIEVSAYAYTLQPTATLSRALENSSQFGYLGAVLYSLLVYFYHGFYEFCLLFHDYASPHTWGAETLWLPLRLIGMVTGQSSMVDLESLQGVRTGVFITFAGPLFIDFGVWAPLAAGLMFYALAYPFKQLAQGNWLWLPAAVVVAVIGWMAPATSLLDSSAGTFLLLAAVLLPLMASFFAAAPLRRRQLGKQDGG